jgi:hypothetical protein
MKPDEQLIPGGASAKKFGRDSIAFISWSTLSTRVLPSFTRDLLPGMEEPS